MAATVHAQSRKVSGESATVTWCTLVHLAPRLWPLVGPAYHIELTDVSDIAMCAYGVKNKQIPDEVKFGKTDLRLGKRVSQGQSQQCFRFAAREDLEFEFVLHCNGVLSPKEAESMLKSACYLSNVLYGRGTENYALPDYALVSRILDLVLTGRVSEYAPHKKLRQLRPGELATALMASLGIGEKIILMSPCLADLGVVTGVRVSLQGVVIRSHVLLSRLQYHSRNPRGSHGYWDIPPASEDYLYLLRDVRGLGFPGGYMSADGQEAAAANLELEETFEIDDNESDLIKLRRRPGIAYKGLRSLS